MDLDTKPSSPGVIAGLDSVLLKSAPIKTSWILSGRPQARCGAHSASQDSGSSTNVWDCTAGAFKWYFGWDETVIILEGGVKVTSPDGVTTQLNVNDVAYFPAGTTWTWEIDTYVRKLAFLRRPPSRIDRLVRTFRGQVNNHRTAIKMGVSGVIAAAASLLAFSVLG